MTTAAQRPGDSRALLAPSHHTALEATMTDQPNDLTRKVFLAEIAAVNAHLAETGPSVPADADLRDRIAQALAREDAHNAGYDHGFTASYGADEETDGFVDAVLAVLPAPADRAAAPVGPPAADGLPLAALDSATEGANALDAWARDPHGRNFLAHALVQLARDGWLRTEPGEGFEPVRDRETPEPEDPDELRRMADEAQQAEPDPTQPRPLTDAELLAWSVVMVWRGMQQRRGIQVLLQPFPPCPECGQTVTDATVARHPATLDERLAVQPCRHWFTITDEAAHNVLEHHGDLLAAVEEAATSRTAGEGTWSTDDIIRNARDCVGEPEPLPASTASLAAGLPHVAGRCPACRGASLFLGSGGHVTCSQIDCPNPSAADQLLHGEATAPAHNGPSVAECAANDRRWWNGEKGGDR